ncbi:MAG: hypothetical protein U5L95_01580 [Candidatus Saccharibacteria bacterium]|nr:hypothetical protein [Candidatus Saccharibacteria bacterium]
MTSGSEQASFEFAPANLRLGRVFILTTVASAKTVELEPALTAPEIEPHIPSVTSGVRRVLQRMRGLYVPSSIDNTSYEPLIEIGEHPTKIWQDATGLHPSEIYRFTPEGKDWGISLILDLALNDWQKGKVRLEDHQLYQKVE